MKVEYKLRAVVHMGGAMSETTNRGRRGLIKAGAATAALGALGFPAISRGQADSPSPTTTLSQWRSASSGEKVAWGPPATTVFPRRRNSAARR